MILRRFIPWPYQKYFYSEYWDKTKNDDGIIPFTCNICGRPCNSPKKHISREVRSCYNCGSTMRSRAIIHLLSMSLFNKSIPLPDFPRKEDISGLGMSDWTGYANLLGEKFRYINTYYEKKPRLDITNIPPDMKGSYDFIISSDVFEHVLPPITVAFENLRNLLKPSGILIFTVPYIADASFITIEHYPELYKFKIKRGLHQHYVINYTRAGKLQTFSNPIFHGGSGLTLEMRQFSKNNVIKELSNAGFKNIQIHSEDVPEWGILWQQENNLPITART
jgi:hypothetical protein